jgi:hypothetical protein
MNVQRLASSDDSHLVQLKKEETTSLRREGA